MPLAANTNTAGRPAADPPTAVKATVMIDAAAAEAFTADLV
jgi:hypothetical protein